MKTALANVVSVLAMKPGYCFQMLALPALIGGLLSGCAKPDAGPDNQAGKGATTNTLGISKTELLGDYALVSVDGKDVPCKVNHEGHTMQVDSGRFVFKPDDICISQIRLQGREQPMEVDATYTIQGSNVIMRWKRAGITEGTLKGDDFTMNNEGMVFAYRKQGKQ